MIQNNNPPIFERFELDSGVSLSVNSNRKLKNIIVKMFVMADLDEGYTSRSLVPMVLRRGTTRLPDMQALRRHRESLYGCALSSSVTKVGEWQVVVFSLDIVNEAFLPAEESLFEEGLELLRELIFDPLVQDGAFSGEYVEREKELLGTNIRSLVDDKNEYSVRRCTEELCSAEPYRRRELGGLDELDGIEPAGLLDFYSDWSSRAPLSLYVCGDVDPARVRDGVDGVFSFERPEQKPLSALPAVVEAGEVREVREQFEVNQARLVLGFRHGVRPGDDAYEALALLNAVLGGFAHSKLFQNVREKASLAYTARSWVESTKGLLYMACGIATENYEKALEISLDQLEAIERGEISEGEFDASLKTIINQNRMLEDNYPALVGGDFVWRLHGGELDLDGLRERLAKVGRDDISAAAATLRHDTTYFLHS